MKKLLFTAIFGIALCVTIAAPAQAAAPSAGAWDNDALFEGYLNTLLYGDPGAAALSGGGGPEHLSGNDLAVYNALLPQIQAAAAGNRTSAEFTVPLAALGLSVETRYTARDLGVTALVEQVGGKTQITEEAGAAMQAIADSAFRFDAVLDYLLADCPYELYWFDKLAGAGYSPRFTCTFDSQGNGQIYFTGDVPFVFYVAEDYRGGDNVTLDASRVIAAKEAVENAREIVANHQTGTDYQRLLAFKEEICGLVEYNNTAATENIPYGDPWQLIYVFDNDETTNVVCEGYSKAFQYLCDLAFHGEDAPRCYTVTGYMGSDGGSATGAGAHMWNIVTLEGENYLVDVTNCDGSSIGAPDHLFLAGNNGTDVAYRFQFQVTYDDGTTAVEPFPPDVTVSYGSYQVHYLYDHTYDPTHTDLWGDALTLSTEKYNPVIPPVLTVETEPVPGGVEVTLTADQTDAAIYYTTDGTEPTERSTPYTAPFPLTATTQLRAVALGTTGARSEEQAQEIAVGQTQAPTAHLTGSTGGLAVTLTCGTGDAQIWYTCATDGTGWTLYESAILLSESQTLLAYAVADGCARSETVEFTCTMTNQPQAAVAALARQDPERGRVVQVAARFTGESQPDGETIGVLLTAYNGRDRMTFCRAATAQSSSGVYLTGELTVPAGTGTLQLILVDNLNALRPLCGVGESA